MNGLVKIYQTKQIIRHDEPIELPTCMYKMKNLLSNCTTQLSDQKLSTQSNMEISKQSCGTNKEVIELKAQQERILKHLAELKIQITELQNKIEVSEIINVCKKTSQASNVFSADIKNISDLVINVNPNNPPYSLLALQKLWANSLQIVIQTYMHSTVSKLPPITQDFIDKIQKFELNSIPQLLIRLIWKNVDGNIELITSSSLNVPIQGESNVARYLSRIGPNDWNYELFDEALEIDSVLDICYLLSRSKTKTERLSHLQLLHGQLGKSQWLCTKQMSIADIVASSVIKQVVNAVDVNVNLSKWLQRCDSAY